MQKRESKVRQGYVFHSSAGILLQLRAPESRWGFCLADDDQTWDGGNGLSGEFELLSKDDPRITPEDRERLGWILEEALDEGEEAV